MQAPDSLLANDDSLFIINICISSVCLMLLGVACCIFLHRVRCAIRSKKRWSSRRRRFVLMSGAELFIQTINSVFYLVPNVAVMAKDCFWFSPLVIWSSFVRWSCWNCIFMLYTLQSASQLPVPGKKKNRRHGETESVMVKRFIDLPFYHHWKPVMFVWLPTQVGVTGVSVMAQLDLPGKESGCDPTLSYDCSLSTSSIIFGSLTVLMVAVYLVNYFVTLYRVFSSLYCVPYNQFRMANLVVRLQLRIRGFSFIFFAVTPIVYFFVRMNSCSSYAFSWLGMAPMQVVETVVALVQSMLSSPANPHTLAVLQVWLQEFAWREEDVSSKIKERASSLPDESFEEVELNKEPLFCFETAVKMLYWANLVYSIDEEDQELSKKFAQDLYKLEHFDVVSSKNLDSKAIVGWKNDCIVISFRGTSSMVNVMSDVRVWRTPFPSDSPLNQFSTSSKVHSGFLAAYRAEKFNKRLLDCVNRLLVGCQECNLTKQENIKVFVTGHSLGGALAVLFSFEIATTLLCAQRVDLHCYVFGSPRVGNHSWASLYNKTVPNTWQIINDDDTITRAGKFFFLYKHVGHRVLINKRGDMLVRPSFSEYSMRRAPGGSIRDHYLARYRRAMEAIVEAQFSGKSLGDVEKIEKLKKDRDIEKILSPNNSNVLNE